METGIKSSFIPSDAVAPQRARQVSRTGFADLLILIGIVLLVASMALAAAVFLYLQFLQNSSASKLEDLQRAKDQFQPSLIQEMTRLDDRMRAADQVLSAHVAPTIFFSALEQLTLQTVGFNDLSFQATDAQNMTIQMSGIAASVNSIALQADYLSKSGIITQPIFSNINRRGSWVNFDLAAVVNPLALRYRQATVPQLPAAPQQPQNVSPFGSGPGAGAPPPADISVEEPAL